jgi:hypothetical protein
VEVDLDLRSTACQNPDIQQAPIENNEASLDENLDENLNEYYMDCKMVVDWEITLLVRRLSPLDIQ